MTQRVRFGSNVKDQVDNITQRHSWFL